jgi:hypothetical protein
MAKRFAKIGTAAPSPTGGMTGPHSVTKSAAAMTTKAVGRTKPGRPKKRHPGKRRG